MAVWVLQLVAVAAHGKWVATRVWFCQMDVLALSTELHIISSQAAVAARKAVPQAQSMSLVSQPAVDTLSLEQVCYFKVVISGCTVTVEEDSG